MNFVHPTYIVLDLPVEVSEKVMSIRRANQDAFRSALPVEITVTGSTGVGVISQHQEQEKVFKILKDIADTTKPFRLSFKGVESVRDTSIYVLKLADETELLTLHERLKTSGINFDEMEHAYSPHCTLRSRTPITDIEKELILKTKIEEEFLVDTLTVYMLDKLPIKNIYSVKLTG